MLLLLPSIQRVAVESLFVFALNFPIDPAGKSVQIHRNEDGNKGLSS